MAKKIRTEIDKLTDIPNVGPSIASDLRLLGIQKPIQLAGRDPYALYDRLCQITGQRHDPCVIDCFIAAVRYMEGGPKTDWWKFTPERKRILMEMEKKSFVSKRPRGASPKSKR